MESPRMRAQGRFERRVGWRTDRPVAGLMIGSIGAGRHGAPRALLLALAVAAVAFFGAPRAVEAKIFASQKQALAEAFPDATRIDRKTFVLRHDQSDAIKKLAGVPVEAKIVVIHVAFRDDQLLGFAEIAVHKVRSQPEAMLIVLTPDGRVRSVRVIAFHEPLDYLPTDRWYAQFVGKRKGDGMSLGREIHGVVGATLSAQAATDAVRRMLAYWEVLLRPDSGGGETP
jgi:Na+-translocating ferredoxin:NAD+ oxidoreductase RnfG subunit